MSSSIEDKIIDSIWSIKSYTFRIADNIDRKADKLAAKIRDTLSTNSWLSESPQLDQSPYLSSLGQLPNNESGLCTSISQWAWQHKWLVVTTAIGLSGGLGYTFFFQSRKVQRKRRAKKAINGARKEVVIISGSPHDPITKSLCVDLERRGFIVFVVVNSLDDEQVVLSAGGPDIRPLHIDLVDVEGAQASLDRFMTYLFCPVQAFPGAAPHNLHLAGMLLIPDSHYPAGPIEAISAADWSDTLNLRLLSPFMTSKLFIRLLRECQSRLLVITPTIINSLTPPFYAPEAVTVAAVDAFTGTLRRELLPLGVTVSQIKTGTFDLTSVTGRSQLSAPLNGVRADISWPTNIRGAYARSYVKSTAKAVKGSSLRDFHRVVFDTLTESFPKKLVRTGSGSVVYNLIGRWAPDSLVLWMLSGGGKRHESERGEQGVSETSSSEGSVEWEKL